MNCWGKKVWYDDIVKKTAKGGLLIFMPSTGKKGRVTMDPRARAEEYLRRMRERGYQDSLMGMDDDDIEYELAKMEEADRRREAQQPVRTVYRPVDPGLKARILRMFGQPYDESAIPEGQKFYLNGWDNGEYEEDRLQKKPAPVMLNPSGGGTRLPDGRHNFFDAALKGGREGGIKNWLQPTTWGKDKDSGVSVWVDPLGMFPQYEYESGKTTTDDSAGTGSVDRYRNSEIVPQNADGTNTKEDDSFGNTVHNIGKKQLGLRYVMGGDGISSTDCGKFTLDTYNQTGVNLGSRLAPNQYDFCKTNGSVFNELSQARPGDLVFFKDTYDSGDGPGSITHVGIYVGDGKMLHAGSSKGVSYADLNNEYWQSHFYGFGRPRR